METLFLRSVTFRWRLTETIYFIFVLMRFSDEGNILQFMTTNRNHETLPDKYKQDPRGRIQYSSRPKGLKLVNVYKDGKGVFLNHANKEVSGASLESRGDPDASTVAAATTSSFFNVAVTVMCAI
ncbi:hypothetical protein CEXT_549241 [Caerostris extrusa]|uniref:Uncharacterized protein n=1 Tax=Caerostris extrusa TaxID=172846 RepID=A0AAV4PPT9_CAEEX|nr:hypothetical protein CEXT_549241 [Caerostris extrusa]